MASVGQRIFIGQFGDDPTSLSYLNARYYDAARGQFTNEDPVHLALGNPEEIRQRTGRTQQQYLADPQLLNSYAYARGNPVLYKDPTGEALFLPVVGFVLQQYGAAKFGVTAGYDWSVHYGPYSHVFSDAERSRARFGSVYDLGTMGASGFASANNMKTAARALESLGAGLDTQDTYFGEVTYARYTKNQADELEGPYKTAEELKPTAGDKARYKIGQMGSGPMSSPNVANASAGQGQGTRSATYAQSVAAWTKLRDGLLGAVKKLQASQR